jgi:ribosomal protein L11 methyltransferase
MFSLELCCEPEQKDLLIAELWERGCEGIVELAEDRLRVFFDDQADREALLGHFGGDAREEDDTDWVRHARDLWQPILAGSRFFLVPEWLDDPTPEGRYRIEINPGQAFGTGVHETTQLCIEALERHVQPGRVVLDVGTGSGILAQVAELLGASRVFACDNDPIAVEVARGNVRYAHVFAGSVDAVRENVADVVIANINPEILAVLAPYLRKALRPGGVLLLSGLEVGDPAPLPARHVFTKNNWMLLEV